MRLARGLRAVSTILVGLTWSQSKFLELEIGRLCHLEKLQLVQVFHGSSRLQLAPEPPKVNVSPERGRRFPRWFECLSNCMRLLDLNAIVASSKSPDMPTMSSSSDAMSSCKMVPGALFECGSMSGNWFAH